MRVVTLFCFLFFSFLLFSLFCVEPGGGRDEEEGQREGSIGAQWTSFVRLRLDPLRGKSRDLKITLTDHSPPVTGKDRTLCSLKCVRSQTERRLAAKQERVVLPSICDELHEVFLCSHDDNPRRLEMVLAFSFSLPFCKALPFS